MQAYQCDICGKTFSKAIRDKFRYELGQDSLLTVGETNTANGYFLNVYRVPSVSHDVGCIKEADLCPDCHSKLKKFIKGLSGGFEDADKEMINVIDSWIDCPLNK